MSALTLEQAKAHLNLTGDAHDAELRLVIDAAEAAIEAIVGPLAPREVTARIQNHNITSTIVLPTAPVVSITSLTPDGQLAEDVADLLVDGASGLLAWATFGPTFTGGAYTVTYMAGRDPVPADLLMAVSEMVRHLWSTQRGPTRRPGAAPSEALANTMPGAAYSLPIRVTQLLGPHTLVGVA